jgi:hypothetical protein
MSTRFGVNKYGNEVILENDCLPENVNLDDFVVVAFRGGGMYWINDLGCFLPDNLKVYPLTNSAQGIYTIKDIKNEI